MRSLRERLGVAGQLLTAGLLLAAALLVGIVLVAPHPGAAATASPSPRPSPSAGAVEPSPSQSPTSGPSHAEGTPGELTLAELLSLLRVGPEDRQGYDRSLFPTWTDADGDGCNTRREVLIDESLTPVTVGSGCSLSNGTWYSVYDGLTFTDITGVTIDHVVALAEAWDSGASGWNAQRREAFANDLGVPWTLIGVSEPSNSAKSDHDPADWLPPNAADRCSFIADWLAIKVRWGLSVDQREHDVLVVLAADCTGTTRPVELASSPAPAPSAGAAVCDPAYPSVCIPPPPPDLDCADVPFRRFTVLPPDPHHFDGDGDGIGCEG